LRLPALDDVPRERRLLKNLAHAAEAAIQGETKMTALGRLLRRLRRRGEHAIVFTEYRDTLAHIQQSLGLDAVLLHGGLGRAERRAALQRFTTGASRLLLATDAGGEGLNLHHACRCVIHIELPWSPSRLEQRTGRVDRIGQRRTVHAFYLIARHSSEAAMLARLEARLTRARQDIGVADPLSSSLGADGDDRHDSGMPAEDESAQGPWRVRAHEEATRIGLARQLRISTDPRGEPVETGRLATRARARLRPWLNGRVLLVAELAAEDESGRRLASLAVPMLITCPRGLMAGGGAANVRAASWVSASQRVADTIAGEADRNGWRQRCSDEHAAFWSRALTRTHAIAAAAAAPHHELFQPGLFDRRVHADRQTAHGERREFASAIADRAARFGRAAGPFVVSPRAVLAMLP
jgi:superfamily II DNA/RNA helicase